MNKLIIPAILATTILVAGMFAFMPVQKASTVHRSLGSAQQGFAINGIDLIDATDNDAIGPGEFLLLSDTTPIAVDAHIALVSPCDGLAGDADPSYTVLAGVAPALTVRITAANLVAPLSTVGSADDTFDGICTYHVDITDVTDIALADATELVGTGNGVSADLAALGQGFSVTIFGTP